MKSESEIRGAIDMLNKALDDAAFKPIPDGTRLDEHQYHRRLAELQKQLNSQPEEPC